MKKGMALAALVAALLVAAPFRALALDSFDGLSFSVEGDNPRLDPFSIPCDRYRAMDGDVKAFITAWLMGYAEADNPPPAYVPADVADYRKGVEAMCAKKGDAPVNDILESVRYGTGNDPVKASCASLNGMDNARDASLFVSWALGYVVSPDEDADDTIDMKGFNDLGNAVLRQCAATPDAALLKVVDTLRKAVD